MRKLGLVLAIGLALMAASLLPVAKHAQASVDVEVGDYWKYDSSADAEGMALSGAIKMKVTGTEGSGATEVYLLDLSGSGDLSGSYSGIGVSGSVDYSGTIKRLVSNFSLVSSNLEIKMTMKMQGETARLTLGVLQTYSPALDDYIGDVFPGYGATVVSSTTVTSTMTMDLEVLGQHITDSETTTDDAIQTIVIAASNDTVSVPAGDFDCIKYDCTLDFMGSSATTIYWYSSEVGNFVKSEGTADITAGFGNAELMSYRFAGKGGGEALSLFSGTNLLIIIAVIVAVVVVVSLVLMMRKRGRAPMPMMPPPEMGAPPPPPPPPGA